MNDDDPTPHRKRSQKKKWGVRYTFIGDRTQGWAASFPSWTCDKVYKFASKRAAENSLERFNRGTSIGFKRNKEWRGEVVELSSNP